MPLKRRVISCEEGGVALGRVPLRFLSKIYNDLEIMRISECVFELFFGFLD